MKLVSAPCKWHPSQTNERQVLYNIGVDDTHNYIAGGVLVGNSHFKLAEPMPNPVYERAIRALTGLSSEQYHGILEGKLALSPDGTLVPDDDQEGVLRGGYAFEKLLSSIDRDKELDGLLSSAATARGQKLDDIVKKAKILRGLKKANLQPTVYLQRVMPVLPPQLRPITITGSGDISYDDLNGVYKAIALDNKQLTDFPKGLPETEKGHVRAELYDGMKSLAGLDGALNREQEIKGILDLIHGSELKHGFFQKNLMKRRQDMTARGVVIPDMNVGMDELGIPKTVAKTLYEPFVVKELTQPPYSMNVADAKQALKDEREAAMRILDTQLEKRPLAMKRDPALHRHSVQGFYPKIVSGNAIRVSPLVVAGYNMDFDGDQVSLYVPVTNEAAEDVKRMTPSNILKSPTSHEIMYFPRLEAQLGLFMMTKPGERKATAYSSESALLKDYVDGKLEQTDIVRLNGKDTTPGRAIVAGALPAGETREKVLHDLDFDLTGKNTRRIIGAHASEPNVYKGIVQKLNQIGFTQATAMGYSVGLKDFRTLKVIRDAALKKADIAASHLPEHAPDRNERLVKIYMDASEEIREGAEKKFGKEFNALMTMWKAGAKGDWLNIRQILSTPMIVDSPTGPVPLPIRHSYSEGLDSAEYWIAGHGARKGMYDRVMEASLPGSINKQLTNVAMGMSITEPDCGVKAGISRPVDSPDIIDRYTAEPVKIGSRTLPKNTLITSQIVDSLKKAKKTSVVIRSPLRCSAHKGMCSKCYGLGPDGKPASVGTNVGVIAAQALGERGTQLALRSFHSAGATSTKKSVINSIGRVRQLVAMPEILPGSATLSTEGGTVSRVEKDPAGGFRVWVGDTDHYVPFGMDLIKKRGDKVKRGEALSKGVVNPHELLPLAGVNAVQSYLADELDGLYSREGVRRVHDEVLVRAVTNLGTVVDPGDHPDLLPSDTTSVQSIEAWNAEHRGEKPVKYETVLKGVDVLPLEQTEDWLTRLAYRRPAETITRGAVEGWTSHLHGNSPVPGVVYGAEFGLPPKGSKTPY